MKRLLIICCIVFVNVLEGFAQNPSITIGQGQDAIKAMYFEGGIAASELFGPRMVRSEGIQVTGSPFDDEMFRDGKISIKNDDPLQENPELDCKIRFNVYENGFVIQIPEGTIFIEKDPDFLLKNFSPFLSEVMTNSLIPTFLALSIISIARPSVDLSSPFK